MEKKVTMFGITTDKIENAMNLVDVYCESCEDITLFTKKTYKFENKSENLSFEYKYCIDGYVRDDDTHYELIIVLMPSSVHESILKGVLKTTGRENIDVYDIYSYGAYIHINDCLIDTDKIVYDNIEEIVSVIDGIDQMLGFYLDKKQTIIGWDGWNFLKHYVNGTKLY